MKRFSPMTVLGSLAVVVTATVMMAYMLGTEQPVDAQEQRDKPADDAGGGIAVSVEVAQPKQRPLVRSLALPASLEAYETTDIYAKTSGYLQTISVDIGSRVRKGDVLLTIDVPEMQDELRQAEAVLDSKRAKVKVFEANAKEAESRIATADAEVERYAAELELWKLTYERKKKLVDDEVIPPQDFDEVKSRFAVVGAQWEIAKSKVIGAQAAKQSVEADGLMAESEVAVQEAHIARLKTLIEYTAIRAPFDGVITKRMMDPGAFVRSATQGAATPLLTIADDSRIRLRLEIPESDVPHVKVGTRVSVRVTAIDDRTIDAVVARTASALKPETRTMRVEVDLDNPGNRMSPGMYAQVSVELESKARVMFIPSKAIRVRNRDVWVYVADGSIARTRPVVIGYDDGIWAEVLEGLSGDEQVIVSSSGIADGSRVRAVLIES